MRRTRDSRVVRRFAVAAVLLAAAMVPTGAGTGAVSANAVSATGSTVYVAVTNVSTKTTIANLNVAVTSGSSTLVGFTSVALGPLSSTVVPVPMSGTVSTLSLTVGVKVSVTDTETPFCL